MKKPIVWTEIHLHEHALARLQAEAEVITKGTLDNLAGAEAAVIGKSSVNAAFLDVAGPLLKMVIRHGAGYNGVDISAASQRNILVAYTPEAPTESTAEHAVGLMLALAKRIVEYDSILRANRQYDRVALRGNELRDVQLGVVGYGRIGRRVVEICAGGLKMPVLVFDPYLAIEVTLPAGVRRAGTLEALLSEADIVTLHVPLVRETRHLIGARELARMKRTAFLINVSRGSIVDETALIAALRDGRVAGAGLDVFDPEPPSPGNPLFQMENVVVTPHIASNTHQGMLRMASGVVEQILQVFAGQRPRWLLNPEVWPGKVRPSQK